MTHPALDWLRANPGSTAAQAADACGLERKNVASQLSLYHKNKVLSAQSIWIEVRPLRVAPVLHYTYEGVEI